MAQGPHKPKTSPVKKRFHLPTVPVQVLRHHLLARVHYLRHLDGPADYHRHLLCVIADWRAVR